MLCLHTVYNFVCAVMLAMPMLLPGCFSTYTCEHLANVWASHILKQTTLSLIACYFFTSLVNMLELHFDQKMTFTYPLAKIQLKGEVHQFNLKFSF